MKTNQLSAVACSIFFLSSVAAHAATTNSWKNAGSGKWETAANWSLNHAPSTADGREMITNAATKTVTIDATTAATTNNMIIEGLYLAGTANSTNTLALINAGTTTPFQVFNGAVVIETNASIIVSASVLSSVGSLAPFQIGNRGGHSSLIISNSGSVECYAGQLSGSNNTVTVTGPHSLWSFLNDLSIGTFGTGNTLRVSNGGTVRVPNTSTSEVGVDSASRSNVVVVTDPGSVWNAGVEAVFGGGSPGNILTITNGGLVNAFIWIMGASFPSSNNNVIITGTGSSMTNTTLFLGEASPSNTLVVADGAKLFTVQGYVGAQTNAFNNAMTITGTGSVWITQTFNIGAVGASNKVTIANSGMVIASNLFVGSLSTAPSNNVLQVSGGSLFVTNGLGTGLLEIGPSGLSNAFVIDSGSATVDFLLAPTAGGSGLISLNGGTLTVRYATVANGLDFIVGGTNTSATYIANGGTQLFENNLVVQRGMFTMNNGTVTVDQLILTNNAVSAATFNGGRFNTTGTFVTNGAQFVIGNGASYVNYHLLGGEHDFNNGIRVSNGASLTGCGTITGDVTIDAGGSIYATCDTLTFTGTVINNGALAANGATLEFYGPVINNNGLLFYNGGTTNFHGTFMNNGIITNAGPVIIASITRTGDDVIVTAPSALDFDYQLQIANTLISPIWTNIGPAQAGTGAPLTFPDPGGATNGPNRFHQIDVIWPP